MSGFVVRPARTTDVPAMQALLEPYVDARILLGKEMVTLYEAVQEFQVAVDDVSGEVLGFGALHVFWEDLGEVRTLAVRPGHQGRGIGTGILAALVEKARSLGLHRLFCLTFEVEFFGRHGFEVIADASEEKIVGTDVFYELVRSPDEGIAEFLELHRVKQNTLGNSRMLRAI